MSDCLIRRMTLEDLDAVVQIEREAFHDPWQKEAFEHDMTTNRAARYLVAVVEEQVIGYVGAWIVIDECQIINIAIQAAQRGHGYGKQLMQAMVQYLSNLGGAYITLQVRVSNIAAQNLYKSLDFVSVGKRKRYYQDNGEDAYLMVCDHMPPVDPDFEQDETIRED